MTINDILTQFATLKERFNEFYALITGAVNADANLDDLTSSSKTAEYNKWMFSFSAMSLIMDSVWADRQQQISDKVDSGLPGTDRWLQKECFKFQYGDALVWDDLNGRYYYAVPDATKQIIARCAVVSSGGFTYIKVAKLNSGAPVALSGPELTAFTSFIRQIQWAGARIGNPVSFSSDKLDAPMTIYYDGTKKIDDIKAIVEAAWDEYLTQLPFNGEYSINKHGDFVESKSVDILEVTMGAVQARSNAGAFGAVVRVYSPVAGYLERDPAIDFATMLTYIPV